MNDPLDAALAFLNADGGDLRRDDLDRETIFAAFGLRPDDGPAALRAELDEFECRGLSPAVAEVLIDLARPR